MNQLSLADARKVILAGNAILTFESKKTGAHFTFNVRLPKKAFAVKTFMVKVLTGSDNESSYTYIGHVFETTPTIFHHGKKSRVGAEAPSVVAFKYVFENLMGERDEKLQSVAIYHQGCCCRCGRTLTTPESIQRGMGPECASR